MKYIALLSMLVMLTVVSCKKDSEKDGDINQTAYSATVVIDGDTITMEPALVGYTNAVGSGGGVIDTAGNYLFRQFTEFASPNDTLRIYFIDLFTEAPTAAQKEAVVHTGTYPTGYGTFDVVAADVNIIAGAAIVYIDANGTRWTTDRDPQNQPNWSFNVSSHEPNNRDVFSKYFSQMTFKARLYNPLNGNFIDVEALQMTARTVLP